MIPREFPLPASPVSVVAFLASALIALLSISILVLAYTTHNRTRTIRAAVLCFVDVFLFHAIFDACMAETRGELAHSAPGRWFEAFRPTVGLLVVFILLLICLFRLRRVLQLLHGTLTDFSIGHALDGLPTGVLLAGANGEVLQTNRIMEDLNKELCGESLLDARQFWHRLVGDKKAEEEDTVQLHTEKEDKDWQLQLHRTGEEQGRIIQILATDVTREKQLTAEWQREVQRLQEMNHRLQAYNQIVDKTIREEELLAAKKRVHDDLGTTLLATRRYLSGEDGPFDGEELLKRWKRNLALLQKEAAEEEEERTDQLRRFRDVATYLGLDLQIMGEMPAEPAAANLIAVSIQECMTNALRHAQATQMYVTIGDTAAFTILDISNNGTPAPRPLREGGGLSMIRQTAENCGARIQYIPDQHFHLRLQIPKLF